MKKSQKENPKSKTIKSELEAKILRYLSYKPRTRSECVNKAKDYLQEFDLTSSEEESFTNKVLEPLEEAGYIDDMEYVRAYIKEQQHRSSPRGPYYARRFLFQKGLSKEIIDRGIKKYYPKAKEKESIKKLIKRKGNKSKPKLINYLLRRGFSKNLVYSIVDSNGIKS
jgi:regulatory protein